MADKELEQAKEETPQKPPGLLGMRHMMCFMMFLGLTVCYALRVILSVTIVTMTDKNRTDGFEIMEWGSNKDTVLSSFFWGYVVTQVPGGQLGLMFGGYPLIGIAATVSSVFTLLLPVSAYIGDWQVVCANRVLQGLGQGVLFPGMHTLIAKWAPVEERGRITTYVYAGGQMGTILGLSLSGVLANSGGGWPSVFYVFGSVGLVWAAVWFVVGANSPATHRWCSPEETAYIEHSLGQISNEKRPPTPWKAIFTSVPLWALLFVHCGHNWGFWTLLTEIPSYMSGVLDFDLKSNALLSSLPYLVMWLLSFVFSGISDFANTRKLIPLAASRKLFNTIGHWIPMAALLGMGYVDKDQPILAVGLLTVAVGMNSATYVGYQVNHIDLSPNFAGAMMGFTNCVANIMSIIGPLLVGVIVDEEAKDDELQAQWRLVFFISSGFYLVGNLIFIIFGDAEIQPWNYGTVTTDKEVAIDNETKNVHNENKSIGDEREKAVQEEKEKTDTGETGIID